ncbi:hypothetical protein BGX21_009217 [Mortierella sp. AD011]|nr:hypothetical protein BGX21_009217 [Mortierella sp. AD011]
MTESNFSRFKNLDAYAKTLDDFRVKTSTGAVVVDSGLNEKMSINFNITFPRVPCDVLTLDVMDVAGAHQSDVLHSIYKVRLAQDGTEIKRERTQELGDSGPDLKAFDENYCGSCYGAVKPPGGCCNTCDHVREAYELSNWSFNHAENIEQCVREGYLEKLKEQDDQGCRLWGELTINKVAGNIHVAPGRSFQHGATHVHDIRRYLSQGLNFSHHITHLSFGEKTPMTHNPLDDRAVTMKEDGLYMFQYYLKVVGTRYHFLDRIPISTNQYSVTQFIKDLQYKDALGEIQASNGLPGM